VRLRALPLLLVLTACDYVLWNWSIAGGHDVLSLISGLTLLPLAAATLALLALGAARLGGAVLEATRDRRQRAATTHAGKRASANTRAHRPEPRRQPQPTSDATPAARSEERGSRRLAA
jgi:hypothetical protein